MDSNLTGGKHGLAGQSSRNGALVEAAFEPVRLRIHPLTHVDVAGVVATPASGSAQGTGAVLVLHYELRDQYTDPVKGLGVLRVEVRQQRARILPGEVGSDELAGDATTWDVADLMDASVNSQRFDPATRTYRVALTTPSWVHIWSTDTQANGGRGLIVRATLTTARGDGTRRVLSDELLLER